jgi:hypothetical protein
LGKKLGKKLGKIGKKKLNKNEKKEYMELQLVTYLYQSCIVIFPSTLSYKYGVLYYWGSTLM